MGGACRAQRHQGQGQHCHHSRSHPARTLTPGRHLDIATSPQPLTRTPKPRHPDSPQWHPYDAWTAFPTPGQHPTQDRYPDTRMAPRQPAAPHTGHPGGIDIQTTPVASTAQPAPRHPGAPARTPAGSRLHSPGGVCDVPDEQGGVWGPGVARHAARGPHSQPPAAPPPGPAAQPQTRAGGAGPARPREHGPGHCPGL